MNYDAARTPRPATGTGPKPGTPGPTATPPVDAPPADATTTPPPTSPPADRRDPASAPPDALDAADDPDAAAKAAAEAALRAPTPDDAKTWGGPDSSRDLNFGHKAGADGKLLRRDASGVLVWADNGRALTPAQWANMPAAQQKKLLALYPDAAEGARATAALAGGDAAAARRPKPVDPPAPAAADPQLAAKLKAALGNQWAGSTHNCFNYAWAVTAGAGGKPLGQAREEAVYKSGKHGTQDLAKMVTDGKVRPGDVIYVNTSPGTDYSSTNLAYGPHWFVYMGEGKWADQYGVKSLKEMEQTVPGRQIDTIFHPFG